MRHKQGKFHCMTANYKNEWLYHKIRGWFKDTPGNKKKSLKWKKYNTPTYIYVVHIGVLHLGYLFIYLIV